VFCELNDTSICSPTLRDNLIQIAYCKQISVKVEALSSSSTISSAALCAETNTFNTFLSLVGVSKSRPLVLGGQVQVNCATYFLTLSLVLGSGGGGIASLDFYYHNRNGTVTCSCIKRSTSEIRECMPPSRGMSLTPCPP
jgi:hypothetical protein